MALKSFLKTLSTIKASDSKLFVIGNSSADYDSIFGSIIFSFILTSSTGQLHVPLIDCRRSDLRLRFDVSQMINLMKIDENSLHFSEEIDIKKPDLTFNLYDHNVRDVDKINLIIDHHDFKQVNCSSKLIAHMGSALTLLFYLLNPNNLQIQQLRNQKLASIYKQFIIQTKLSTKIIDPLIDQILRIGILTDCFNFDPKQADRWTKFDLEAIKHIEKQYHFQKGFEYFQNLRFDLKLNSGLTLHQNLIKDFKRFSYGNLIADYSIIYIAPSRFFEIYENEIKKLQLIANVYFYMCIFKNQNNQIQRQIVFKVKNDDQEIKQNLEQFLTKLKMQKIGNLNQSWNWWKDPSAIISRKIIDKQLRKFLESEIIQKQAL